MTCSEAAAHLLCLVLLARTMHGLYISVLILSLTACAWVTGCQRHSTPSRAGGDTNTTAPGSAAAASEAPPSPRGPGPMPGPPAGAVVVSDLEGVNSALEQLSVELRKYVVRTRTVPKTYEEFISKSNVQAPEPPPGKKYAIQNQAIVLVKR